MARFHKNNNRGAPGTSGNEPANPSRRNLLKGAGVIGAGTIASTAVGPAMAQEASDPNTLSEALEVLTSVEAQVLEAVCDRIIPSDQNGPGAREARAVNYIDRSLASHNSGSRENYMLGLNALNDYAMQTHGKAFASLTSDDQDSILLALERDELPEFPVNGFFNTLRNDTIEGTFCDPYYGGNHNFVGWDLLQYPGVRQSASDTEVRLGADLAPNHRSAYSFSNFTKSGSGGSDA